MSLCTVRCNPAAPATFYGLDTSQTLAVHASSLWKTVEGKDVEATTVACMALAAVFIMSSDIGSADSLPWAKMALKTMLSTCAAYVIARCACCSC